MSSSGPKWSELKIEETHKGPFKLRFTFGSSQYHLAVPLLQKSSVSFSPGFSPVLAEQDKMVNRFIRLFGASSGTY